MTPEIFANHAMALARQNRLAEALAAFDQALQLQPGFRDAHHNRGVILQQLGRLGDAVASYDRALAIRPDAGTLYNRANALLQLGRTEDALESYGKALKLAPNNVESLVNRGYALMRLGRPDEALPDYEKALQIRPDYADAHYNRGVILIRLNRPAEALGSFDTVLRLRPDYGAAFNDRGIALLKLRRPDDALASFERAVQVRPDHAEAHYNRGVALANLNRPQEAIASFDRALRLAPANTPARVLKAYQQARICDWGARSFDTSLLKNDAGPESIEPFLMLALDDDPASQLARATRWTKANYPAAPERHFQVAARPERLRIGYFSADFHDHATMHLMARLFELHDRNRFEVHAFSFGETVQDAMRARVAAAVEHFHDVADMSDKAIVELARAHKIDIALDLKGYTKDCRPEIFARRAAPVQASYLGYPGTMGADFIDYIIADPAIVPPEDERFYAEKVVRLPHAYQANDNRRVISGRSFDRAELGLPKKGFVFCCFNNSYKISPAEFDIWMRLLGKVEDSVLWLLKDNEWAAANLAAAAQARGIDAGRIVFAERMAHADHLARHRRADLFLDTFNYNAHTTASDALWAGLPIVTRRGRSFPARVAASLLRAIGLPELATDTAEGYEQLALDLATDPARLDAVKARLAANRLTTPLFDSETFARDLEKAYDGMFQRYLDMRRGR